MLSEKSIEFAINHLKNFYDSDFFITPFEFNAIFAYFKDVQKYLSTKKIEEIEILIPNNYPVPKPKGGYRIVHQLDPINTIIYTALTYEVAEYIERFRIQDDIACSYRISIDFKKGHFFTKGNGQNKFYNKCLELSDKLSYVLVTDLTDFYNQIYLHRLQNAIEACDPCLRDISKKIEWFLMKLNNDVSQGIPVGPAPSIILAEAVLIDIDQFILEKGFDFTRYVDDYVIFSDSKEDLELLYHDLTGYLYDNHRLTLASGKTKLLETDVYKQKYLLNPENDEKEELHKKIEGLSKITDYGTLEPIKDIDSLPNDHKIKIRAEVLMNLITSITDKEYLDLGLARHILRRARLLKSRVIIPHLLDNFDFFIPVMRDLILYFDSVTNKKMIEYYIDNFATILDNSFSINIPYVRYWLYYYFTKYNEFHKNEKIKLFVNNLKNLRNICCYAKTNELMSISRVRTLKTKLNTYGPWDKRAVMYASRILSSDEKIHWMQTIENSTNNFLEKILCKYIKSN